jgi:putative ABC transport system permease protein
MQRAVVVGMTAVLRPLLRAAGGIVGAMAARGVVTALSRTGPAMMALVVAVSVTVGLGVMIQSFRTSVATWLDRSLEADLYVSAPSVLAARPYGQLPRGLSEEILALEGVEAVHASRGTQIFLDDGTVRLSAWESLGREGAGTPPELLASVGPDAIDRFLMGEGALVSEPFATRRGTVPGDTVMLPGEAGPFPVPVLAVYRDYGSDAGAIRLIRSLYDRHWDDPTITSLGIFLASGADEARVEEEIRAVAGAGLALEVRSNQALRAASLEVFDRTFAITRVLRILAFVVAFMAVLSALMALQLERGRELAVLRANGLTPGQTWGLVTTQTGVMGAMAGVLATPVGVALAAIMIQVVNRRSFGWSMEMVAGPELLVQAIGLAAIAALLAGVYPSHLMSRTSPAGALRGE